MRIKRLRVENIRSYEDLDISFESGVTVVSGVNGSGKSSLLEACFIGIFGSRTISKNFVLSDMIRKGATRASIHVDFDHNGREYSIKQEFRNDPETGRASTTQSVFMVDGTIMVDQANQTYEAMKALLKMDEEAYTNCVYIRQGEVDVLINAKPADRQRMIDDLLQIGKLEEYRERAKSAGIGVRRHQRQVDTRIKENLEEIKKIRAEKPIQIQDQLRAQAKDIGKDIFKLNDARDGARSTLDNAVEKVRQYSELDTQRATWNNEAQDLKSKKKNAFDRIETSKKDIQTSKRSLQQIRDLTTELKKELGVQEDIDIEQYVTGKEKHERDKWDVIQQIQKQKELHISNERSMNNRLTDARKQLDTLTHSIQKKEEQIRTKQSEIRDHRDAIRSQDEQRGQVMERVISLGFDAEKLDNVGNILDLLTDTQKHLHGNERETSTKISQLEASIQKSQDLLAKGKCPTCGQDLKGSTVGETVEKDEKQKNELQTRLREVHDKQKEIEEKLVRVGAMKDLKKTNEQCLQNINLIKNDIKNMENSILEYQLQIEENRKRDTEIRDNVTRLKTDIDEIQQALMAIKSSEDTARKDHDTATKHLKQAKRVREDVHQMDKIQDSITRLEDTILNQQETMEFIDGQINERQGRIHEIDVKMQDMDIKGLQEKLPRYKKAFENITIRIEEANRKKEEVHKHLGRVENDIQRLAVLEKKGKTLYNKLSFINAVYRDAQELEEMYIRLRAELRAKNVKALGTLLNEIFSFMYTNNAYSHIELDSDYELTIYEKDGTPLKPKLLSGGERAIFNLVLRCAIYRLLSMGIGDTSDRADLPPLIMDEPTVFLDRGHIHQLIELIDLMRDIGVGQILIVSHDESLIDSADNVFEVDKDPVTNISSITPR
ncbi:MAG: AAA family ATPase [Euryarchaeota archaeon]|nr:AAA family ATPase [Euryarchaeota archaeon]